MKNASRSLVAVLSGLVLVLGLTGCMGKSSLKKTLEENPDILFNAIEKNPKAFFDVLNKAAMEARKNESQDREKEEQQALEEDFKNPKVPEISGSRIVFGKKDAPVTIVEYSDFQCPFCSRAANTMDEIMKKYPNEVRLVYKHLPFKQHAELAARYYEAIGQDGGVDKAKKFYDKLYQKQGDVHNGGEKAIEKIAKEVGANIANVKKLVNSESVSSVVKADIDEANKFGFQGTPGFLVNGVRVNGAYPLEHFVMIIDRHLKKGG